MELDHAVSGVATQVVSEWSRAYTLPSTGSRVRFRGCEWYVMEKGRIAEVRAYYEHNESKDCQLNGFPYADQPYLAK